MARERGAGRGVPRNEESWVVDARLVLPVHTGACPWRTFFRTWLEGGVFLILLLEPCQFARCGDRIGLMLYLSFLGLG